MSYNTRRTPSSGGGSNDSRRTPTTQVNYHQQPQRTANTPNQARNTAGYTSTPQQPATAYNSAAQPAFTTQPAYSTAPPLPKASQQSSAQPQQAKPQLPSQPARNVATTPTPIKAEPITPQTTPQTTPQAVPMESQENGEGAVKKEPFWKKRTFVKVPPKVKKARMNAKLRRLLIPKNALNFLHELRPKGYTFTVKEEKPGWGFTVLCKVDGKSFTGNGMTVAKAKLHASENALKHLMMEELAKAPTASPGVGKKDEGDGEKSGEGEAMEVADKEGEGGEPKPKRPKLEEDPVPWCSLAAFALHKLFDDWQRDSSQVETAPRVPFSEAEDDYYGSQDDYYGAPGPMVGDFGPSVRPPFTPGRGRGFGRFAGRPRGFPRGFGPGMPRRPPPAGRFLDQFGDGDKPLMRPAKAVPPNAEQMNPVMLLNQLKPHIVYTASQESYGPPPTFLVTIQDGDKTYSGRGRNKKEAKRQAAIAALAPQGVTIKQ